MCGDVFEFVVEGKVGVIVGEVGVWVGYCYKFRGVW